MAEKWQQWYKHHINRWNGSAAVQIFTDAAYRAYHNLLMAQFESDDGMLEENELARASRMGVRWAQPREGMPTVAEEVLEEFERAPNGKVFNLVMYQEWQNAKQIFETGHVSPEEVKKVRSEAGKKGAAKRWDGKRETDAINLPSENGKPIANDSRQGHRQEQEQIQKPTPRKSVSFAPPEWVPLDSWEAFVKMRKKIRAPLTEEACCVTVRELEKLARLGHDPGLVLMQSVQRDWRGVFEIKGGGNGNGGITQHRAENRVEQSRGAFRRAAERRGITGVDGFAGPDGGPLPTSGAAGRDGGCVAGSNRAPGGEVHAEAGSGSAGGNAYPPGPEILPPSERDCRSVGGAYGE